MKYAKYVICFFLILLIAVFLVRKSMHKKQEINRPYIVCTTSIIADAVKNLVEGWADVECIMGPGIDPHIYKPRSSDIYKISSADLVLFNGLHLEGKMIDIFENLSRRGEPLYAVGDKINPNCLCKSDYENTYDPHIWFDTALWISVVKHISEILIEKFPLHTVEIQNAYIVYEKQLETLDSWVFEMIEKIPKQKRVLVTAHDAFEYFGKRYGVKVEGLQGISTDAEVSLSDIQRVAQIIIHHQLPAIFIEQTIPEKYIQGVQRVVQEKGIAVDIGGQLYSDALGERGTGAEAYISMVKHNVETIVSKLSS